MHIYIRLGNLKVQQYILGSVTINTIPNVFPTAVVSLRLALQLSEMDHLLTVLLTT